MPCEGSEGAENGASLLGFCGVSLRLDSGEAEGEPIGSEKAVREEPTIMAASMSNMG